MVNYRKDIKSMAVIGSGTMGRGIVLTCAQAGIKVYMIDINMDVLNAALEGIKINLKSFVGEKVMTQAEADATIANIVLSDKYDVIAGVDFVLEAVPEVAAIKEAVYKEAQKYAPADIVIASNTSGTPITKLGKYLDNPGRMVGMHWWNPAHITPVVEMINGDESDPEAMDITVELTKAVGRYPVVVKKDVPGFLGNRLLYAFMREALWCYENGVASAEDIDMMVKAGFAFKFPVLGPLQILDMAGLDIFANVSGYLWKQLDNSTEPDEFIKNRVAEGKLGIKSGQGFYEYKKEELPAMFGKRNKLMIALLKSQGWLEEK